MKELILKRHAEELADAEAYRKLAAEHPEWEQIFHKIADDEIHHAELLKYIVDHV